MFTRGRNRHNKRADQASSRAKKKTSLSKVVKTSGHAPVEQSPKSNSADEVKLLLEKWRDIVDHVGRADALSRRYFLGTSPLRTDDTQLVVGYDPEFKKDIQRLESSHAKLALARAVERHLGRMLSVVFEPLKPDDPRPVSNSSSVPEAEKESSSEKTGVAKWYANPVVKTVVEAFNGEITDVRE